MSVIEIAAEAARKAYYPDSVLTWSDLACSEEAKEWLAVARAVLATVGLNPQEAANA